MSETDIVFDYAKLRGRIVERCGKQSAFAKAMGINEGTLSNKLSGKSSFTMGEVVKACEVLDISMKDVSSYFFVVKV